jgi:AbrB family looped-hinge helix DNA binding protein
MIPMDQAGRIVLPKAVRQELAINPGDVLRVSIRGLAVTLTPSKEITGFVRKGKALVFSTAGEAVLSVGTVEELMEEERDEHHSRVAGSLAKPRVADQGGGGGGNSGRNHL